MPRRPALLLTSPRSIPNSALFCFFCTLLQKSEAHPFPFQPVAASLQKPQARRQQRSPLSASCAFSVSSATSVLNLRSGFTLTSLLLALSCEGSALLHQSERHPLPFQSVPHSLCVYPGCHPPRFILATRHSSLATKCIKINTCAKSGGGSSPNRASNRSHSRPETPRHSSPDWVILPSAFWRNP
jgi:hypothetical protein